MVKFSVKKPYTVLVAVIIVILLGVVSFGDLKVDLLPSIDMPYSLIVTAYPGATPEEVEANVTEPIESAMATISNIKSISSSSSENYSTVTLEFEQNAKMDAATVEIRETLNQITEYWDSSIGNPIIVNINPDMIPVLAAAVSVSGVSNEEATRIIDEQVTPRIESLEGVARADITGNVTTDISVRLDQDKISEVNEKIKNKIEEKLSEAEQELADAKAALEEGQAALDQGQSVAMEQFSEAERQMAQGNNALIMGLLELNEKETEVNLALTALQVEEAALQASIAAMEAGNGSGSTNSSSLPNVNIQIPDINGSGIQTVNPSNYNPPTLEELKAQLADVQNQIAQLKAAQEQMAKARTEIDTNKTALEEAQAMASQAELQAILEMANAQAQIYVGKSAIESGEKQLEAAKEQSLSQADISSMLTADTIGAILMAQNFDMPAGYINEDKEQILVRVGDRFEDIDQISKLVIFSMEDFEDVRLKDVSSVEYVDDSDRVYSKVNGETGILMLIQKQTGYSTSEVSNKVQERLETIHSENPSIGYAVLMDQGIYINLILKSVLQNILIGAALAIILLILFLRSWRPTLIIAISIPVSILAALVLMFFTGVSLNIISLSALALGVGMLVDNSIVVIENIYRLRGLGMSVMDAAIDGARQMVSPIISSTLTTVCVFAPIVFTEGMTKDLFVDMGLTIAYSLLASLIVAITVVPAMAGKVLKKPAKEDSKLFDRLKNVYSRLLHGALKVRVLVIILTIAFMVGSVFLALSRGMAYMPDMESNQASITFTTDEDTSFEKTAEIADTIMERLMKYEDVVDIGARIGSSSILGSMGSLGGGGTDEHAVTMYAVLKEQKSMTNDQFVKKVQEEMSDLPVELNIDMASMDLGSMMTSGIAINITGQDLDKLQMLARQCASVLENTEGCIDVDDGMDDAMPEFRITVDKTKAMAHSLTVAQVYQEIYKKIGTKGSATALKTDTGDFDIYVTDSETDNLTREDIKNMVFNATNALGENVEVALKDIASFEDTQALTTIKRASQNRYLTVKAAVNEGYNVTQVASKINRELKNIVVPEGYTVEMKGEDSTIMDAAKEILKLMALAIVLMYLIMVAQFQSLKYPFIIMITIPLAFTGGFLALFIAGLEVSIVALVGFVMLAGIIVNNGIVLIDYTNQLIAEGKDVRSALIEAGKTRLRPIFMTALTTILGLVTLAAGLGMGADMVQPMAVVTIGGLIYGTLLTLFAVPCMYLCMTPKKKRGEQVCLAEGVMEDSEDCREEADEASEDAPCEEEPCEDSEE